MSTSSSLVSGRLIASSGRTAGGAAAAPGAVPRADRRPWPVSLLALFLWAGGAFGLSFAFSVADMDPLRVWAPAAAAWAALSVAGIAVGFGLWSLAPWSWRALFALVPANAVLAVWMIAGGHAAGPELLRLADGLVLGLAIDACTLVYLLLPGVRRRFGIAAPSGPGERVWLAVVGGALYLAAAMLAIGLLAAGGRERVHALAVRPSLEDRLPDGSLYSAATQSPLRRRHWLETVPRVELRIGAGNLGEVAWRGADGRFLRVVGLPLEHLAPRLHYRAASPPDAFDAFNLMLAEFSRNGLTVPTGEAGREMAQLAHFETDLPALSPWSAGTDGGLVLRPEARPFRVGVTNNCLRAGLWELEASDRSSELYHAWFDLPADAYTRLVAAANELPRDFVRDALAWSQREVRLDLGRLRRVEGSLGRVAVEVEQGPAGYSSQESRRKLGKDFAQQQVGGQWVRPRTFRDFSSRPTYLSQFVEPGLYSSRRDLRKEFDYSFLAGARGAEIRLVSPRTDYNWLGREFLMQRESPQQADRDRVRGGGHLEIALDLGAGGGGGGESGGEQLILGNLPLALLVEQAELPIYGFGVGVLAPGDFAERRRILLVNGPRPSYAYLAARRGGALFGLNSHDRGLEQVWIRSHPWGPRPHWELTLVSYERIADVARYRIDMPAALVARQRQATREYRAPDYFYAEDDNLR
jgi:hypothetical protein